MPGKRKSTSAIIVSAAIFISLEIAALTMLFHNTELQRMWFSSIVHGIQANVWGKTESIRDYFSLEKKNHELAQENERLSRLIAVYEDMLGPARQEEVINDIHYIPAEVAKMSFGKQRNYMILSKGSDDGVVVNSGVITRQGAVGIVEAVSRHYSYALTFNNTEVAVSVRAGKDGAIGPLSWDGIATNGAVLKEIPIHLSVEPGDTILTSGFSSIFPPDIPIGTAGDSKIVNGSTKNIEVSLFEDFRSLRFVTVVSNTNRKELEELENQ
ncbi:MAG: rod shape-determining protein MreC [Bacteroidales bacterium]|nr:rod shape-determining protein MreC [Bacteroidales bacterium]